MKKEVVFEVEEVEELEKKEDELNAFFVGSDEEKDKLAEEFE